MKILVSGGAGFIGSHLVDALAGQGHQVIVVDNLITGKKENLNSSATFYEVDITNSQKLAEVFEAEKPEAVFHLAAQIDVRKSVADPTWDASQNIIGSLNLLELSRKQQLKKFIFSSSGGAIYGDTDIIPTPENHIEAPVSPYGVTKLSIEKYLHYYYQVHGLQYISLRYSNVYGPRQNSKGEAGVVAIFIDRLFENRSPLIYGDGKQTRDFVFVGDVVKANLLALNSDQAGVFNIGTGVEITINEAAAEIKKTMSSKLEFEHGQAKVGEQQRSCLDASKARQILNWEPAVKFSDGIKQTINYFKKN